jgi:hypothetical protein
MMTSPPILCSSGKQFTILWLRDYQEYCQMAALYDFDYFDESNGTESHVDTMPKSETGLDASTKFEQIKSG